MTRADSWVVGIEVFIPLVDYGLGRHRASANPAKSNLPFSEHCTCVYNAGGRTVIQQTLPKLMGEEPRKLQWDAPNPLTNLTIRLRRRTITTPSNTPIPRPAIFTIPNSIRMHSAVLPQYTRPTDRPTDMTDRHGRHKAAYARLLIESDAVNNTTNEQQTEATEFFQF